MPDGGTPEMLRDAGFNGLRRLAFGHESGEAEPIPRDLEGIYFWLYIFDRADFKAGPNRKVEPRRIPLEGLGQVRGGVEPVRHRPVIGRARQPVQRVGRIQPERVPAL